LAENDHPPPCNSAELRRDGAPLVIRDGVKRKGLDLHYSCAPLHPTLFCVRLRLVRRIGDHMVDAPIRQTGEARDWIEAVAEVDNVRERAHVLPSARFFIRRIRAALAPQARQYERHPAVFFVEAAN